MAYRALRIVLSGRGPFRLGGIRAWGRYHGERLFEDPGVCPEPARLIPIAAAGGWTDTGGDVTAGRAVIIDIEGTWSLDADDNGPFGWCGPEGFAENALRGFFSSAAAFGAFRDRLPAPHLPAGALIARIGLQGRPVLVEPGRPMIFPESGHLWLGINDAERLGNRGTLSCTIVGAFFPHAGATSPAPDLVRIRCIGRITSAAIKRPVPGVDVFLQMEAWPRRIHGGARTDNEGRFDFEVLVPRGQNVVIGAPEFKLETTPRSYDTDGEFRVDFPIK